VRTGRILARAVLVAACAFGMAAGAAAQTADVSGRWELSVSTPDGVYPAVLTLRKAGETLTGTIAGSPGEFPIAGTQKGADVVVSFTMPRDDGPMAITLAGTQTGDAMKGTATFGPDGDGTWSGTRAAAATTAAAGLTGTWALEVTTGAGSGTPTLVLEQTGETVTGSYTGQLGQAPVTGTVKGREFMLALDVTIQDVALHVVYTGTLDADSMSGTVTLGDLGEGSFKGRRQAKP
jgi:hypothetical protein